MEEKSFGAIVDMICKACNGAFYHGTNDLHEEIIRCATKIYIAQMNTRTPKERGGEK